MAARRRSSGKGSRKRDYKAEYARRVAGTKKGSPERQKKRGKAPKEKARDAERREGFEELWGAPFNELRRLRKAAFEHILAVTTRVNDSGDYRSPTHPQKYVEEPNQDHIRRSVNNMNASDLEFVLGDTFSTEASAESPVDGEFFNPWLYH